MYCAVTATRRGLTEAQLETARRILRSPRLRILRLSHGDAPGGDAQLHALALELGLEVHIRPSDHPERAHCEGATLVHEPLPPLERNAELAGDGWLLLAFPAGFAEEQRSGTWSTVRAARRVGQRRSKGIIVVWPDGTHATETTPAPPSLFTDPNPPPAGADDALLAAAGD